MINTKQHYGWLTILLHWSSVLLVIFLFALGYWMVDLGYYDSWYKTGPALHKSIGITFFLLMLIRIFWRLWQTQPQALNSHTTIERKLGHLMHWFLYFLILFIMVNGYLISTADGRGIEVFQLFEIPSLGSFIENQEDIAGVIHQYSAYLLIVMVLLHAAAALKHHFIDKDKTLTRMLGKK
jgi:cytochrome b561